ncbi:hypothetical protein RHS04_02636 [Rhizoctonia solani]|uniref:Transposase family Tnp2 protein n=1 Tax=Rhizoctonia solani TaxID=456999 RepID=A0A8H7LL26_9AGAM|nr:hypothetical protein RHS04_02636 [Rhizoctonia solani]
MNSNNFTGNALGRARRTKKGLGFYEELRPCDCTRCHRVETIPRDPSTIATHHRRWGRHQEAGARGRLADNIPMANNIDMGGPSTSNPTHPDNPLLEYPCSEPASQPQFGSDSYLQSRPLSPSRTNSGLGPHSAFPSELISWPRPTSRPMSRSRSRSSTRSCLGLLGPCLSESPRARSEIVSFNRESITADSSSNDSDSDYPDYSPEYFVLKPTNPENDAELFGEGLAGFRIATPPAFYLGEGWHALKDPADLGDGECEDDEDKEDEENEEEEEDPEGPQDPNGDPDAENEDGPPIQVDPEGEPGPPEEPGDDGDAQGMPALNEHPILRNIYLRTWIQYAFAGVTQDSIQAILESHKSSLLALADLQGGAFPADFAVQVHKMPTTLRSLERRLGLDFADLITIFPVCPDPDCGKRYTMEQLENLRTPQCIRRVGEDRCPGVLYTETKLATGKQKRTPSKSFPYNSLPKALGRLLSRPGIARFMQHWRLDGDEPIEENVPPPIDPEEWFHEMGPDDKFGDISQASGWRNQEVGLRRRWDGVLQEYIDEPTGEAPLSLVCLPYGISLGLNSDGYQAHGKFAAGGNYSVTGVYIIVNNLPFYLRHMIENIILVIVMPGPKEPKGYALSQMLEPLVNDLIELMNGMDLPVYNSVTGQTEQRRVYAKLSVLLMDWIARIKCIGHVGATAEHNHCPYCKMRQCLLGEARGYRTAEYELRDPHEHLQAKHEWQREPNPIRREEIRQQTGTTFTIFDQIPGFYSFDICPPDSMHLFDLGITPAIIKIVYKLGMLRKRYRQQPSSEIPEARFDAFMRRCYFPHFCGRLPTKLSRIGGHTKAEQWNTLLVVLPAALFEAWRVGNSIPENEIPRGGQNTRHFKQQQANARRLLRRRRHVHDMDQGELDNVPELGDCFPSRNPRDYFANILRYCVAHAVVTQHRLSRQQIDTFTPLFELIATTFAEMNINLPPIFHAATHLRPFLLKYGSVYGTRVLAFERVNRMLINVNTNGHGQGVLEATMAKGFLRRAECYRYVKIMQSIEEPTADDTMTTNTLLKAMRNGPEHEIQREMLDAVLAGQAPFRGQEHIRLATVSAKISFHDDAHSSYYPHMIEFCNNHYPFNNARFYGPGVRPPNGIYISPTNSTVMYSHFHRYGVRYGSAHHSRGYNSRFGFIYDRKPVIIKGIYATTVAVGDQDFTFVGAMVRRFILPVQQPVFPWDHWDELLQIQAWEYRQFAPVEPVPLSAFTGVFAMSDIQMSYGRYTLTFAMIKTHPEDLVEGYNNHDQGGEDEDEGNNDEFDNMDED